MASSPNFTFQGRYKAQTDRVSGVSVDIIGKHGNLIATEPCQKITRPGGRPKSFGHHLQDPIPECVAVEIVDVFEVVKVYQEERMLTAIGRRRCGCCRQ